VPGWLLAALVLVGCCNILGGVRWALLLRTQGIDISLGQSILFTLIGQFFNSFLLGSTGGDAARLVYAVRLAPNRKTEAALTIALDRALGLGFLLIYALLAIAIHARMLSDSRLQSAPWVFAVCLAVLCAGFAVMIYKPLSQLPLLRSLPWPAWCLAFFVTVNKVGRAYLSRPVESARILAVAAVIPLVVFIAGYCLACAFNLQVSLPDMMLILPIVFCASSVPITISGFGVRESLFVYLFGLAGIVGPGSGSSVAIAYSVTWYALGLFWGLGGGLLFIATKPSPIVPESQGPGWSSR